MSSDNEYIDNKTHSALEKIQLIGTVIRTFDKVQSVGGKENFAGWETKNSDT
jgi:hypothetical protein